MGPTAQGQGDTKRNVRLGGGNGRKHDKLLLQTQHEVILTKWNAISEAARCLLTTGSIKRKMSWRRDDRKAGKEIDSVLLQDKSFIKLIKSPPLDSMLRQLKPLGLHTFKSFYTRIYIFFSYCSPFFALELQIGLFLSGSPITIG